MGTSTEDQIAAAVRDWQRAWDDRDLEGMLALYEEDARLVMEEGLFEGRSGQRAFYEAAFAAGPPSLRFETVAVHEGGDLVVEVGRFGVGGAGAPADRGAYSVTYRRRPGGGLGLLVDAPVLFARSRR